MLLILEGVLKHAIYKCINLVYPGLTATHWSHRYLFYFYTKLNKSDFGAYFSLGEGSVWGYLRLVDPRNFPGNSSLSQPVFHCCYHY